MEPNTPVRFTVRLGAVEKGTAYNATKYIGTVEAGQLGLYQGPMVGELGEEGWHLVAFGAWDVACHESHYETAGE